MRAIDLYSGAGGWSLGLALAGIEVVASYERFEPANETNRNNNRHNAIKADIRCLDYRSLPQDIDLVVGSPPCTQFSFSNRGGSGDLIDGLRDIRCFLSIVDHIGPRLWAMENVPRTAEIVTREMKPGGLLEDFAHLNAKVALVNMEDWGLPQRRKRCVIGNFDLDLLLSYGQDIQRRTLGEIVHSLSMEEVVDPIYGLKLPRSEVIDHEKECPLNEEEERVNRASKLSHPVYNVMQFPDPLDKSARTITATCTRVSRESIVIADPPSSSSFRRLTLRERATVQGFPLNFQFFGASHGQKATMIGNAVPPLFAYYVANACREVEPKDLVPLSDAVANFVPSVEPVPVTRVDLAGRRYRADRTFRFAVPGFNFKSGVRFEFSNNTGGIFPAWGIRFYFGNAKSIHQLALDHRTLQSVLTFMPADVREEVSRISRSLTLLIEESDIKRMQDVWTRRGPGGTRPFDLLDRIAAKGQEIRDALSFLAPKDQTVLLARVLRAELLQNPSSLSGLRKIERHVDAILAGALMGAVVNEALRTRPVANRQSPTKKLLYA
jgi:DNA (cytosine-5)-methyltransferase 1